MGDVLIVACGGGAGSALRDYSENHDKDNSRFEDLDTISNAMTTATIEEFRKKFKRYRVVVPFIILGGSFGMDRIREIIDMARESGCKVVSVFGIPMEFEIERRERALRSLTSFSSSSDCSFVIDMQRFFGITKDQETKMWNDFIMASNRTLMFCVSSLVDYLSGPFFSTFTKQMYSFTYHSGMIPEDTVAEGWNGLLFDQNPELDDVIVMVSRDTNSSEIDGIRNRIARDHGVLPQIIRRSDAESTKFLIFRAVRSF